MDIIKKEEFPDAKHLIKSLVLNEETDRSKLVKCKACGNDFMPPEWFFYGLCDICFRMFDTAKMNGRFGLGPKCEDVDKWLADMREGFDNG
jgi:hypothetical protein